jgi:hypothetical protein
MAPWRSCGSRHLRAFRLRQQACQPYLGHMEACRWDGFIVAGLDDVSLVPDADIASAVSNAAVEINPSRPMPKRTSWRGAYSITSDSAYT